MILIFKFKILKEKNISVEISLKMVHNQERIEGKGELKDGNRNYQV